MLSNNLVNGCDRCIYISSHQYERAPPDINLLLFYVPFYTLEKIRKPVDVIMISGYMKRKHWALMGYYLIVRSKGYVKFAAM